jgi:hypothetical protein
VSYSEQPVVFFSDILHPEKGCRVGRTPIKNAMNWKSQDWIEHSAFGLGRVNEDRGDRLDIEFVASGAKTILKSTDLKPALSPSPDFKFPREKNKSRTPRFKVERPPRRPPLDFNHLVEGFPRFFDGGFESKDFEDRERKYKTEAANQLKDKLGKDAFESLLRDGKYAEVCHIAKDILDTNLAFKIEKVKFSDGVKSVEKHNLFANALYDLLHGSSEMEARFTKFSRVLSEIGANNWPIATYFQFLASDGRWMFMKPSAMKRMADSLKIALNYKAQPNWLTYLKLQELANRVDLELRNRNLSPRSGIDVQGFVWTSIQIEEGQYGKTAPPSNGN